MRLCSTVKVGLLLVVSAIAADVDGKWNIVFQTEAGERSALLTLAVDGRDVTGVMAEASGESSADGVVAVEGTYENGELALSFPYYSRDAGYETDLRIRGRLQEDKIMGSYHFAEFTGTFEATRQ